MPAEPFKITVASSSSLAQFMTLTLRVAGYDSYAIDPAMEDGALASLVSTQPAALVIDATSDVQDRLALCARIRAVSPIPIAFAGWRDEVSEWQTRALREGATACLLLPLDARDLVECVRRMLPQTPDQDAPAL